MNIINSNMKEQNSWRANLKLLGIQFSRYEGLNTVAINMFVLYAISRFLSIFFYNLNVLCQNFV
jgi:hypothetical protein